MYIIKMKRVTCAADVGCEMKPGYVVREQNLTAVLSGTDASMLLGVAGFALLTFGAHLSMCCQSSMTQRMNHVL